MYYGFDLGGTKIEFGAFEFSALDAKLTRLATERVATPSDDYQALLAVFVELVTKYDAQFNCEGMVGIGIPGIESQKDGTVLTANIPAASGKPLRADLSRLLGREIALNNDANCFALSEAWDEALQGESMVLGLILGTGFGGGIVMNGKVVSGASHVAGEFGHTCIGVNAWQALGAKAPLFTCGCGKQGCLDSYLSGRGFELLYQDAYGEKRAAVDIIQAFRQGEAKAVSFVDKFVTMLSCSLADIITAFDPDVIVLGGGLSNFSELYQWLPERLPAHLLAVAKVPKIIAAKYGDAGGVRGAACLNLRS